MQVQTAPDHAFFEEPQSGPHRDPYRGVVLFLLGANALVAAVALYGGIFFSDAVLLDASIALALSASALVGTAAAQVLRSRPRGTVTVTPSGPVEGSLVKAGQAQLPQQEIPQPEIAQSGIAQPGEGPSEPLPDGPGPIETSPIERKLLKLRQAFTRVQTRDLGPLGTIRVAAGVSGLLVVALVLLSDLGAASTPFTYAAAGAGTALCLIAAGLSLTAARYFSSISPEDLPEASGLARGARLTIWMLVGAGASIGLIWFGQQTIHRAIHFTFAAVIIAFCVGLLRIRESPTGSRPVFPLELGVLSLLGSRTNLAASILDTAERQMGIDLRSTWALTVVRTSVEPLAVGLLLFAWISTSLTVVGPQEQGLVEHWGVPGPDPLSPGLHLHWPWPADTVTRIPVKRIQMTTVGHEGQEEGGPENVLWAVEHAPNEFTLLLGDGRDLITVDATVQYRISNAQAWRYSCQNPEIALRAIAYRAVMKNTVNHTLPEVLSENVSALTGRMRAMVQRDADALGLGVDVVAFTVGGMHPPVAVAAAYESVVSAQIAKVTSVVNAQVYRNEVVPSAEQAVLLTTSRARGDGARMLAQAAGEAWSFRVLEAQYRSAPAEFFFRRRLESLEKSLPGRQYMVIDSRFERDGGELWLTR
jgi:regulator of protease activity HflC (stomatin/prohibitin superfamily)